MDRILKILKKENGPRALSAPALELNTTSISFYKKLGLRFAYINLNVKESDRTPISSWFM